MTAGWVRYVPTGPYNVGARDVALAGSGSEATSSSTNSPSSPGMSLPLDPSSHLVGRLYYPTKACSWSWPPTLWVAHVQYAYGYVNSLLFSVKSWKFAPLKLMLRVLIWALGGSTQLAVTWNAPLLPVDTPAPAGNTESSDDALHGAVVPDARKLPVIVFSHGLIGNRNQYSSLCLQLASQGYVVLALEHADGSASAARLAIPNPSNAADLSGVHSGWRFYGGWGNEKTQFERTRWRLSEVGTACRVLQALESGQHLPGLAVTGLQHATPHHSTPSTGENGGTVHLQRLAQRPAPDTVEGFLCGRLDLDRLAVAGHSWGGATAALAGSQMPCIKAVVTLDPWWEALPPDCALLADSRWSTQAPMLVIGSHDWNVPSPRTGRLSCGGKQQETILAAIATSHPTPTASKPGAHSTANGSAAQPKRLAGPGAVLLVPRDSSHHSFDDVLLFFNSMCSPILRLVRLAGDPATPIAHTALHQRYVAPVLGRLSGLPLFLLNLQAKLEPHKAIRMIGHATSRFLADHLPPGPGAAPVPVAPHEEGQYRDMFGPTDLFICRASCAGASHTNGVAAGH